MNEEPRLSLDAAVQANAHEKYGQSAAMESVVRAEFVAAALLLERDLEQQCQVPAASSTQRWKNEVIETPRARGVSIEHRTRR
jgi:hypothetical protein